MPALVAATADKDDVRGLLVAVAVVVEMVQIEGDALAAAPAVFAAPGGSDPHGEAKLLPVDDRLAADVAGGLDPV